MESDGLFTFGCCGFGDIVPDDAGFVDIQSFARELRAVPDLDLENARVLYERAKDALNIATPSGWFSSAPASITSLRASLDDAWGNVTGQPSDPRNVRGLNEVVIQSMIEMNASHAGDLAWAGQKSKVYSDIGEAIKNAPAVFVGGLSTAVGKVGEAIGQVTSGAAQGAFWGFLKSPVGFAVLGGLGYLLWKSRGRYA